MIVMMITGGGEPARRCYWSFWKRTCLHVTNFDYHTLAFYFSTISYFGLIWGILD